VNKVFNNYALLSWLSSLLSSSGASIDSQTYQVWLAVRLLIRLGSSD